MQEPQLPRRAVGTSHVPVHFPSQQVKHVYCDETHGNGSEIKTPDPPELVKDCQTRMTMQVLEVTSRISFTPAPLLLPVKGLRKEYMHSPGTGPQ